MNIQVIAEHSVDLDLLNGGICIDAGCRGFLFSEAMRDAGCEVLSFDIEYMKPPDNIKFSCAAVMAFTGEIQYVDTIDLQAKYVSQSGWIKRDCISLNDIYKWYGENVDILKLDIEGSEYLVLSDEKFKPIPKQVSVEFHIHAHKKSHDEFYQKCMDNLLKHYVAVKHELTEAHGAGFNFWDSLFIRKDLIK